MTNLVSFGWFSTDHFLCLNQNPSTIVFEVYRDEIYYRECCINISRRELPPNIDLTTNPRAVVTHLIAMREIGHEYDFPNPVPVTISTCQDALQQAIDAWRLNVSADRAKPEQSSRAELEQYRCPLTSEFFVNPVTDVHGHTFENRDIQYHLEHPKAVCPINRLSIETLAPNRSISKALDEWRVKGTLPNLTQFKEANEAFAQSCADMAHTCVAEGKSSEAFEYYEKMVQYTKNPELYKKFVALCDTMKNENTAILSRLYLVSYLLKADQVGAACQALEEVHSRIKGDIKIVEALVELYLYAEKFHKAIPVLTRLHIPDNDYLKHHLTTLCCHVLARKKFLTKENRGDLITQIRKLQSNMRPVLGAKLK